MHFRLQRSEWHLKIDAYMNSGRSVIKGIKLPLARRFCPIDNHYASINILNIDNINGLSGDGKKEYYQQRNERLLSWGYLFSEPQTCQSRLQLKRQSSWYSSQGNSGHQDEPQ